MQKRWFTPGLYAFPTMATPSEVALYGGLAERLHGAMQRAGMTPWQMGVVSDELIRASQELADAMPDDPPAQQWVTVPTSCRACRRALGEVPTLADQVAEPRDGVLCDGCAREGR